MGLILSPEGRAGRGADKREPTPKAWALASHPLPLKICSFSGLDSKRKLEIILLSQSKYKGFGHPWYDRTSHYFRNWVIFPL